MNRKALLASILGLALALTACSDADVASRNISKDADNFGILRRIVFINGITDQYLMEVTGYCSILDAEGQLEVTCKTGPDQFKKHFLGLSDNVTYFAEQLEAANVSDDHYKVIFKPSVIVPDPELR